jgi:YidC/Oxa1 family membrane protein insertase
MERIVDLGWTWIQPFSKLLLVVLNGLHAVVRNYGIAILLLATLVRVLLHPLNMMSIRSMRSMQKIQPEVERLRKKYEKDPQALNTAIMALYKENKVNPAGGCLPMLLQMPLFIALYSVLYNAIELRQAPFVGWIHDLSAPDLLMMVGPFPLHVLPILMALSGFLSQKLTPTDPRQAPTMYLMNVFMLVFFYKLPSGLVLYWTIMNVLTALQQWLALREDDGSTGATVVRQGSATA